MSATTARGVIHKVNDKKAIDDIEKQKAVLQLRRAGASFQQIAEQLHLTDRQHANKVFKRALRGATATERREAVEEIDDQLLTLYRKWWPRAIAEKPDYKAADIILKIQSQRAALYPAPTQVRVGGAKGAPPIAVGMVDVGEMAELSDAELEQARTAVASAVQSITTAAAALAAGSGGGEEAAGEDDGGAEGGGEG